MTDNPFTVTTSPTTEPESLLVGSYSQWRRLLDYSDAIYTLSYRFISTVDNSIQTLTGTYDSDNEWWVFEIASADTAAWTSGTQRWDLLLTRNADSEVIVISTGSLILHASTDDRRTHAEIMVQKIESLLSGRADNDVESYTIKSRSLTRMSPKELRDWREYYLAEIERTGGSTTSAKRPKSNTVRVRWV